MLHHLTWWQLYDTYTRPKTKAPQSLWFVCLGSIGGRWNKLSGLCTASAGGTGNCPEASPLLAQTGTIFLSMINLGCKSNKGDNFSSQVKGAKWSFNFSDNWFKKASDRADWLSRPSVICHDNTWLFPCACILQTVIWLEEVVLFPKQLIICEPTAHYR